MMMGMVELVYVYILKKTVHTLNASISLYLFPYDFESIFFEVQYNQNKPIILGVVFRPNYVPRADVDMFISNIIEIQDQISNENKITYLMGDYNINLLNFVTHKTNAFIDNVISQGVIPHVTKPTRITSNSATLIDHLYLNHNHPNYESGIIITDVADHFGIFHIINLVQNNIIYRKVRQLTPEIIASFRNRLHMADY